MPDTSRSAQLYKRAGRLLEFVGTQKTDRLLQDVHRRKRTGVDVKVGMAACMFEPLQFSPPPKFTPANVRPARALCRQISLQKNK